MAIRVMAIRVMAIRVMAIRVIAVSGFAINSFLYLALLKRITNFKIHESRTFDVIVCRAKFIMCKLVSLAKTFNGAVFLCEECDDINIRYGTFQIAVSRQEYADFIGQIREIYIDCSQYPITKKYVAHVNYKSGVAFVLDGTQVSELLILLRRSSKELNNRDQIVYLLKRYDDSWRWN